MFLRLLSDSAIVVIASLSVAAILAWVIPWNSLLQSTAAARLGQRHRTAGFRCVGNVSCVAPNLAGGDQWAGAQCRVLQPLQIRVVGEQVLAVLDGVDERSGDFQSHRRTSPAAPHSTANPDRFASLT